MPKITQLVVGKASSNLGSLPPKLLYCISITGELLVSKNTIVPNTYLY